MMAGRVPAIILVRSESLYAIGSLATCAFGRGGRPMC